MIPVIRFKVRISTLNSMIFNLFILGLSQLVSSQLFCSPGNTICVYSQKVGTDVEFTMIAKETSGWFALGLGAGMNNAEVYLGYILSSNVFLQKRIASGYSLPSFVADFPFDSSKSGIINGNKQIVFKRPALSNFSTNFLFAIGDQPTSNTSISVHFAKFTAFANPFLSTSALPSSPPVKSAARSTLNTQMSFYQVGLMTAALGALVPFEIAVIVVVGSYVYIYHGIYFAVCIGLLVVAMMMYVYSAKKVEQ